MVNRVSTIGRTFLWTRCILFSYFSYLFSHVLSYTVSKFCLYLYILSRYEKRHLFCLYPPMLEIIFILWTLPRRLFFITLSKKISSDFLKICEKLLNFYSSISSKSENFSSILLKSPQF